MRFLLKNDISRSKDQQTVPIKPLDREYRLIQSEKYVSRMLEECVTPFVATLNEATVNVRGLIEDADNVNFMKPVFVRIISMGRSMKTGFGWRDAEMAFRRENKFAIGTEKVICLEDHHACFRRVHQRLELATVESHPPLEFGDGGDSLYKAVSLSLWGNVSQHLPVRAMVMSHMTSHPEEYQHFLGDDYWKYIEYMSKTGSDADEIIVRATADAFGIPITVLTGDEVVWCLRYPPKTLKSGREIFLAVGPPANFSCVRRQSAVTKLMSMFTVRASTQVEDDGSIAIKPQLARNE